MLARAFAGWPATRSASTRALVFMRDLQVFPLLISKSHPAKSTLEVLAGRNRFRSFRSIECREQDSNLRLSHHLRSDALPLRHPHLCKICARLLLALSSFITFQSLTPVADWPRDFNLVVEFIWSVGIEPTMTRLAPRDAASCGFWLHASRRSITGTRSCFHRNRYAHQNATAVSSTTAKIR